MKKLEIELETDSKDAKSSKKGGKSSSGCDDSDSKACEKSEAKKAGNAAVKTIEKYMGKVEKKQEAKEK